MSGQLNVDTVQRRLRAMRERLDELGDLGEVTAERLRSDWLVRAATEWVLTQVVELAVEINVHVVVAGGKPPPVRYRDSFEAAAAAGVITADLAQRIAPAAGLRNVLVHRYLDADLGVVADAVTRVRDDFSEYVREVARWLVERLESEDDRPAGGEPGTGGGVPGAGPAC